MEKEFDLKNTMKAIDAYADKCFFDVTDIQYKPFYHVNEWSGWRFYLKALRHRDWKSIKGHIKELSTSNIGK